MASEASEPLLRFEKGPVHVAAQCGDVAKLKELSNEQLRETFGGATALHLAAAANQLRAMDLLMQVISLDALDQQQRTPLMHAVWGRSAEAVVWLCHRKANLEAADSQGFTALHLAASQGSASVCALLLTLGASLDVLDLQGRRALDVAVEGDRLEVVEQLVLGHGAKSGSGHVTGSASGWVRRCLENKVGCHELLPSEKVFGSWTPPEPWSCLRGRPEQVQAHPREMCVLCGLLAVLAVWSLQQGWQDYGAYGYGADTAVRLLCALSFCCTVVGTLCFFTAVLRSPGRCEPTEVRQQRYQMALRHAAAVSADSMEEPFNWWGTKGTMVHELQMLGPERSKFCTAKRQCVPMFDHYCAFLRNSVGPGNYGAFFGCVVCAFICCVSLLISAAFQGQRVILCFFALVSLLLGAVLLFHLGLNAFALTTWEMLQITRQRPLPYLLDEKGEYRNDYDRGFLRNLKARLNGEALGREEDVSV